MRSLHDPAVRDAFRDRLRALRPDAAPRFGRLSAPAMLSHLVDTLRMTLGDQPATERPSPFRVPGLKYLVVTVLPWPKGRIAGPPEAFTSAPGAWEADRTALEGLMERFAAERARRAWPPHPSFGAMSGWLWDRFTVRHMDHHLRQFGV